LIGDKNQPAGLLEWDLRFPELPPMLDFQKQLIKCLPLPAQIQVLVIDDELEVGSMIQEYFENRSQPSFKVVQAFEGGEGLERIQQSKPDIIILDIKMPKMGGREFYQQMLQKKIEIPVVVFFDAILGDELEQICRMGKLMVVEKGSKQGSPPELISVIEKAIFFS
jgi:CheY-like chemotaxis protein